jgi:YggT family protein
MSNDNKTTEVKSVQKEQGREHRTFTFKAPQLVWLLFGILETLILLRILLKLLAANPDNQIAAFIYSITSVFLAPFAGLTGTPAAGGMVLELSSLLAVVVYALIAWVIERIIWLIFYRPRGPVEEVTQSTSSERRS